MKPKLSIRALAPLVNRSTSAVGEWPKRKDWPFGPPPWKHTPDLIADVLAWMDTTFDPPASAPSPDLDAANLRKANALAEKYERQNLRDAGQLVDRAAYQAEWVTRIATAKNKLLGMPAQIAPALVGEDVSGIEHNLRERIEQIIREIGEGGER